jgi:hypothetical protein
MSQQQDEPPAASDEDAGAHLPIIELDTLLDQPPSQRKRLAQIGLVLAAFLVVLITFWNTIVPRQPSVPPLRVQPTLPPPTLTISSNVNYGVITINGQVQPGSPPLTLKMHSQPPYTITLDAPPFRPRTCEYPPPQPVAPYVFNPCDAGRILSPDQQALNTLEMLFTPADLPPEQRQQITALISHGLTAQQTITAPARSTIVTGLNHDGTLNTLPTTAPLYATAFLVPGTQNPQGSVFCFSLACTVYGEFSPDYSVSGQFWEVLTPIALRLRFTTASGHVVSDVTFPASPALLSLLLSYQAAVGWQLGPLPTHEVSLSAQLNQLICITGAQMLGVEQARYLSGEGWDITILHDAGIAGCELALAQNQIEQGRIVWRFGALLAADAKAHSILPTLPIASPADLAAVGA